VHGQLDVSARGEPLLDEVERRSLCGEGRGRGLGKLLRRDVRILAKRRLSRRLTNQAILKS
jgi:hypothetical protein